MTSLAPSSTKSIMLWSSKFSLFEPSIYESGGQYPEEIAEMINALETGSVASVVRPEPHWNMLDVGAGGGRWSISFSGRVGSVTALEPSAIFTILKERTEAFKNIVCHRKAFEEFAASSKFNLIIISGVLMYILEPLELEKILRKAVDLTENGGFLVLREPVARAERCFTDTSYRSPANEIELDYCKYWEVVRTEAKYESICASHGLRKVSSFASHAPFFYHVNWPRTSISRLFRICVLKAVRMRNFRIINAYNQLFRGIFGRLGFLMNRRTMKIMVFAKNPRTSSRSLS